MTHDHSVNENRRAAWQNQYWSSLAGSLSGLPSFPAVGEQGAMQRTQQQLLSMVITVVNAD